MVLVRLHPHLDTGFDHSVGGFGTGDGIGDREGEEGGLSNAGALFCGARLHGVCRDGAETSLPRCERPTVSFR